MRLTVILVLSVVLLGACHPGEEQAVSPTATATAAGAVSEGEWYSDAEKEAADPDGEQTWVAAWFVGEDAMPESISRWWRPLQNGDDTPGALLARSVERLDEPPEGMTSAFARGLAVHDVTLTGDQVLIDMDAESPGLYGQGSTGYVIGSAQLVRAAAFYFPNAETLCVAYDGEPTAIEEGGPSFLHDASGCPMPLR